MKISNQSLNRVSVCSCVHVMAMVTVRYEPLCGDLNGDNRITPTDATIAVATGRSPPRS